MKFFRWHTTNNKTQSTIVEGDSADSNYVPLAEQVKKVQSDYIQSLLALGRANAEARRTLAEQTLVNIQGIIRHAPHNR